jgi:hypothetical protein
MPPNFAPYGAARTALLQALARVKETPADQQALAALATATERFRQEEQPILTEIGQAWDNNVTAIAAANQAFAQARQALTALEIQVGEAARARNPTHPLFTDDELTQLQAADAAVEDARAAVVEAKQALKAGVTVEQLEAL